MNIGRAVSEEFGNRIFPGCDTRFIHIYIYVCVGIKVSRYKNESYMWHTVIFEPFLSLHLHEFYTGPNVDIIN